MRGGHSGLSSLAAPAAHGHVSRERVGEDARNGQAMAQLAVGDIIIAW